MRARRQAAASGGRREPARARGALRSRPFCRSRAADGRALGSRTRGAPPERLLHSFARIAAGPRPDEEVDEAVASNLGAARAPSALDAAFGLAKSWLDTAVRRVDELRPTAARFFHAEDLPRLKGDFKSIREQWETTRSAGEVQPDEGEGMLRIIDEGGYRFVGTDMGGVLADCRGPGERQESLITFYPRGVRQSLPALAATVIHELSHASSLATGDVAYHHQSAFERLNESPGLARKNADSYTRLATVLASGRAEAMDGAAAGAAAGGRHRGFSEPESRFADRTLRSAAEIATRAGERLEPLLDELDEAIHRRSWDGASEELRELAEEFPRSLPRPEPGETFRIDEAERARELLDRGRSLVERVREVSGGSATLENDPQAELVCDGAARRVGARFFTEPEPDAWMQAVSAGLPTGDRDHRLLLRIARFLSERQDLRVEAFLPGPEAREEGASQTPAVEPRGIGARSDARPRARTT